MKITKATIQALNDAAIAFDKADRRSTETSIAQVGLEIRAWFLHDPAEPIEDVFQRIEVVLRQLAWRSSDECDDHMLSHAVDAYIVTRAAYFQPTNDEDMMKLETALRMLARCIARLQRCNHCRGSFFVNGVAAQLDII